MQVSLTQNDAKDVQNSWEDIVFGGDLHASETRPKQRHLVDKESLNNFWGKKASAAQLFFSCRRHFQVKDTGNDAVITRSRPGVIYWPLFFFLFSRPNPFVEN